MSAVLLAETSRVAAGEGPWRLAWRRLSGNRLALISLILLLLMAAACFASDAIGFALGLDGSTIALREARLPPSLAHPFGTDPLGRDLLIRTLEGGRVSLSVGLITALLTASIGTLIGLSAGYFGGRLDSLLMRLADGVIALPVLPLLIILAVVDLEELGLPQALAASDSATMLRLVLIIALFGWPTVARLVRGATLSVRARDYVRAAQALGAGHLRIMARHILPNVASPLVVATTLSVGNIILVESVLSFLGLGIQPPTPSWGNMLTDAQGEMQIAPHLAIFPGAAIFLTVIAFNLLGDGLQDALDPKLKR